MKLYINIIAAVTFLLKSLGACFPLISCLTHAVKMSSEVCPFCGKTYKRLKSHLPHCKAAARSRSPPNNQTTSSQRRQETSLAESSKVSTVSSSPEATSTKKKKPKLSEQIKMAVTSLNSSSAPAPDVSKPKKKSVREAAKSDQVAKGSVELTKSASINRTPGSEPIDVSKKTAPKTKRAAHALSTTRDTDFDSLGSEIGKSSTSPHMRNDFRVETEDLPTNKMLLKPGSNHRAQITIQDVKAALGRVKTTSTSNRIRLDASLSPEGQQTDLVTSLVTTKTKPKQTSLIALKNNGSSHPKPNPPAAPLLSTHLLSQVGQATRAVSMKDRLKVGHHATELPSVSQMAIQPPSHTLPAKVEMLMADRKQNGPHGQTEGQCSKDTGGAVMPQSLGQVRLKELPEWLARKTPGHPRDVVEMVQRGWRWYYRRYIDVRKGGVGGLSMLLAGYCVLSYIWSYPHIKHDRWRKYH